MPRTGTQNNEKNKVRQKNVAGDWLQAHVWCQSKFIHWTISRTRHRGQNCACVSGAGQQVHLPSLVSIPQVNIAGRQCACPEEDDMTSVTAEWLPVPVTHEWSCMAHAVPDERAGGEREEEGNRVTMTENFRGQVMIIAEITKGQTYLRVDLPRWTDNKKSNSKGLGSMLDTELLHNKCLFVGSRRCYSLRWCQHQTMAKLSPSLGDGKRVSYSNFLSAPTTSAS